MLKPLMNYKIYCMKMGYYQRSGKVDREAELRAEYGEMFKEEWDRDHPEEAAERKRKEKIEAIPQIEEEVRALLQKDPDDLTGREVKRLKELQSDPDIDMEDFLTMKEYKKLLSIIGEPKKEEPSEMSLFGHPIQFDKQ